MQVATKRLRKEFLALLKDPVPNIVAVPLPSDILEWHYLLFGPEDTDYLGGVYHGIVRFPSNYPYSPPSIQMITPNGRFQSRTRICLSMSDFHPETWNPMWSVSSILTALLSFFVEETPTFGSVTNPSPTERRQLAAASMTFNMGDPIFVELFGSLFDDSGKAKAAQVPPSAPAPPPAPTPKH
ncbi:putative Ubiquitin-conjugating enzyme E2 J2 [Paratrimastix pyriformis]|uniref:Ubiquitin-conjugating enzyme E2 J2 n=1 Tax=Paratrimastix pyriformis TaxID=342808 RepID=A0ABQ8UE84_9EUKA|nr:putative Ubiquitin-conjugating enzyme E2 J2 [Paratrimastix pyriformis]